MALKWAVLTAVCAIGVSGACSAETVSVGIANGAGGIGAAPLVVGVSGHHFADFGIEVALTGFADDSAVEQAVTEGRAEFGAARLDGAFFAYAAAHGLTIIAPEYSDETGYPATGLLISKAAYDAGLRDPRSLAHRRIGMTAPDAAARFELMQVARHYGIASDAIELVWLGTEAKQLSALADGSVDAVAVPFATAFELRGEGKGAAVIRLSDYAQAQQGVVFTRAETIRTKRAEVETFMRAYLAAVADYDLTFQQRDDDGGVLPGAHFQDYLTPMARQAGIPRALLAYALPYCDHLARLDVDDLGRQLRFWQHAGLVPTDVALSAVVDLSLNPQHIGSLWIGQAEGKF
jgi:NitT/TauT family transport system substrate-binding protein